MPSAGCVASPFPLAWEVPLSFLAVAISSSFIPSFKSTDNRITLRPDLGTFHSAGDVFPSVRKLQASGKATAILKKGH